MSTISNAAQVMVDKLVADMQGQTPLSSEEQLLVAKALDTMKNNVTFENALVAVAEEHLNTATSSLLSAEGKINAAKDAIVADADNLALIPDIQGNVISELNKMQASIKAETDKIDPTVQAAIKVNMASPHRKGVLTIGALETLNARNSSFRSPIYSNDGLDAYVIPYTDNRSGRVYTAYINRYYAAPVQMINVHFGYWKDSKFTTLYKVSETATSANGPFVEPSSGGSRCQYTFGAIVPLAKHDDPNDVRVSLVIASSYSSTTTTYSWRSVISTKADGSDLIVNQNTTGFCEQGDVAAQHALCANYQHFAYEPLKNRVIGYKGSFQYYDLAVGVTSDTDGTIENVATGVSPTFNFPASEMNKKIGDVAKYIIFTSCGQNYQPLQGRFAMSQGQMSGVQYTARGRSRLEGTFGYAALQWWNMSGIDWFSQGVSQIGWNNATTGNSWKTTYFESPVYVFTYLTTDELGICDIRQIYYSPNFVDILSNNSTYNTRRVESLDVAIIDGKGISKLKGTVPIPAIAQSVAGNSMGSGFDFMLLPQVFNEVTGELHVLRASREYPQSTNRYCMYSLIYRM